MHLYPQDEDDTSNIFDHLPSLARTKTTTSDGELDTYLNADIEDITDAIAWWYGRRKTYPRLSRMALNYLTIPGLFFLCS